MRSSTGIYKWTATLILSILKAKATLPARRLLHVIKRCFVFLLRAVLFIALCMAPSKRITDNERYANFYFTPYIDTSKKYLANNATIIKYEEFETGVVKILSGRERALTERESVACRSLVKNDNADIIETHDEENFAERILAKNSKKEESGYMNCKFLLPTPQTL